MATTILYLEDNDLNFVVAQEMLKSEGVDHVTRITNIKDFKSLATSQRLNEFDLLLIDIMLPDGNATELFPWLRDRYTGPLVAYTACTHREEIEHYLDLGFDDVFVKPMGFDDFSTRFGILTEKTEYA